MRVTAIEVGGRVSGVTTSADPYITSFVGPYADLGGCDSCDSILDQPYEQDDSGLPLAQQVGYVMGIPALAKASKDDKPNVIVARATNLSSLVAATLLNLDVKDRERFLEETSSVSWTNGMLKFAGKIPGALAISDAVRFSLAMHFIIGIYDTEMGKDTPDAQAYRAFAGFYKEIEAELKGGDTTEQLSGGLSGLGQAAVAPKKKDNFFKAVGKGVVKGVVKGAKATGKGIAKAADWSTDILCKGLKGLLGDAVGGAICWILTKGLQVLKASLKMLVEVTKTSISGLWDFIKLLGRGKIMEAISALLQSVTRTLFLLFLPVSEPFLGIKADKLKELGDKVSKKNPFFPITLILAIIGILSPSPLSIGALVIALSPAIAVLIAPGIAKLTKASVNVIEKGVEVFLKIAVVIFQGIMALSDIIPRLRQQTQTYLKKKGGTAGLAREQGGKMMDKLREGWGKITASFKKMKFSEISAGLAAIFSIIPDVLAALGSEIAEALPAIDEVVKTVKQAKGDVQAILRQNSQQFYNELKPANKKDFVLDEAKKLGIQFQVEQKKDTRTGMIAARQIVMSCPKPEAKPPLPWIIGSVAAGALAVGLIMKARQS